MDTTSRHTQSLSDEEKEPRKDSITNIEVIPYKSTDNEANQPADVFKEGGLHGWLAILGAWFILFATFGYLYSFGVFQDFYTRFLLSSHSPGKIAWVGSLQLMMPFFMGAISGKLFDAGHFHALQIVGGGIFVVSLFMLSLVKPQQYYQPGCGSWAGLTFVPIASIAAHYFRERRGFVVGIALSGGAMGSVVFPIMLNHLIPTIGFKKAVQSSGYIVLGLLVIGNALIRTKYPKGKKPDLPDIKSFFVDIPYMLLAVGGVFANLGVFFPVIYLQLFAVKHNIEPDISFYSIAIVNGMGGIGRIAGNYMSDKYGPLNIFIPCTIANAALVFAVFGVTTKTSLIIFSIIFGIVSGAWLSLTIAVVGSLARRPEEIGARTGVLIAITSFGALGAAPAQGALLTSEFIWHKPIIFSGVMLGIATCCFTATRMMLVREYKTQKV